MGIILGLLNLVGALLNLILQLLAALVQLLFSGCGVVIILVLGVLFLASQNIVALPF